MNQNNNDIVIKKSYQFLEWLLYMLGYCFVFYLISSFFDSFYISKAYYGLYGLISVIIISFLNHTIKPILVSLTIPITGLTLGLFYPCINLFILKLTDWLLRGNFDLKNIKIAFFIAILLSFTNLLMEGLILKPILRKVKKL